MYSNFIRYSPYLFLLVVILSCKAPRNNPLDPENPDNKIGIIEGFIKTSKVPQSPISDAKIFWVNEGIITNSDGQGYFILENIERIDGQLIIEKDSYSSDSLYINFDGKRKITENIFLNATPKIVELKFYSITTNKFPADQNYNLEVSAKITDEENDIDSVFIENLELNTKKELLYNASTRHYSNTLYLEDLNITSIDIVIGKDFLINVLDANTDEFQIGKSTIKRIIKEEIETTEPSGRDTVVTKDPLLQWRRFTPGFEFRYILEIYTDEIDRILVWQNEISSEAIEFQTNANLSPGDYFWVIWAIDEFENRTRSKPASFIIK